MRTIKFRGVNSLTGEYVYAELGNIFMTCKGDKYYFGSDNDVKPETVCQYVGKDINGHEVYEGDELINLADGTTFKANITHTYVISHYRLAA